MPTTPPRSARSNPAAVVRRVGRDLLSSVPVAGPSLLRLARWARRRGRPDWSHARGLSPHPVTFRAPGPRSAPPPVWPVPADVEGEATEVLAQRYPGGSQPIRYDLELFEQLNAEYATRPLVPAPPQYDEASMRERAQTRLVRVHEEVDLGGKRVLEFGCGSGYELWTLAHAFGAEGWGVDIIRRRAWDTLADDRTRYALADLAVDRPFEADSFDRIVSFTVFEHVEHPRASLTELFRVLRPGGLAWIKANLYRGPMASHRYREVYFPFPHLLFTDEVFSEFQQRHGRPAGGAAWVNRLSWTEYEEMMIQIGFRIRMVRFTGRPLDEAFYTRFEDILGRYPRQDLQRDFFEVVLEKPAD